MPQKMPFYLFIRLGLQGLYVSGLQKDWNHIYSRTLTLTHSHSHSHSLTHHSLTHPLAHSLTHSLSLSLTHVFSLFYITHTHSPT